MSRAAILGLLFALLIGGAFVFRPRQATVPGAAALQAPDPLPPPPVLRPRRVATPEAPLLAHEELLALDGTPAQDISALADLTHNHLLGAPPDTRAPLGFNEDLARALTDRATLGESAIPPEHPALRDGLLIDRWGTPWHVHPLDAQTVQLRSAGPDRRLFTADDLVHPAAASSAAR